MHQHADKQQQKDAAQHDKPQLQRRQPFFFKAGVGLGQQGRDVQPLALGHLDLRYQHRRVNRLQGQGKVRPRTRQLIELQARVENA